MRSCYRRSMLKGIKAIAALEDDLRRRLYTFVRTAGRPVSRDEAAAHVGISRKLAAFHLDKLVERGLLSAHYARVGTSGRGPGRSSKLYEPSDAEFDVSVPTRRYDIVGEILVAAVGEEGDKPAREIGHRIAHERGRSVGSTIRSQLRRRPPGPERTMAIAEEVLEQYGFEPYASGSSEISLRNCPFHRLAQQAPDLVCALNREFVDGMLRGMGNTTVDAVLQPTPGECCVKLRRTRN
jgi:predicted ArsR family transcriptional regulator